MTLPRTLLAIALIAVPPAAAADLAVEDLPSGTVWYMHADLEQMRTTESGRELYGWFEDEVVVEINDEVGINLDEEVDRVTAFSDDGQTAVIIVEGTISADLQQQVLRIARDETEVTERSYRGTTYYEVRDDDRDDDDRRGRHRHHEPFEDGGYFTYGIRGKVIAASSEERLKAMIDDGGRVAGAEAHRDALFVLTADKDFVQAGMRTDDFGDDDDDWDSNILRNTEQAALLISDMGGQIAVDAKLVSTTPQMTIAIGNIVNGLISLQALNDDMDPNVASVLRNTKVDVEDTVLSISTVLDAAVVLAILED